MPYDFSKFKQEIKNTEEWLGKEFSQIHSGRATPAILDGVFVESYGAKTPLAHVASISVEDPKTLRVSPWDKSNIKEIERGITAANLGLSTAVDDAGVRVIFPPLTTESRTQLVKVVSAKMEEARIRLRVAREETWSDIQSKETEGILTEDEKFRCKEDLQKLVDEGNSKFSTLSDKKETEIMN